MGFSSGPAAGAGWHTAAIRQGLTWRVGRNKGTLQVRIGRFRGDGPTPCCYRTQGDGARALRQGSLPAAKVGQHPAGPLRQAEQVDRLSAVKGNGDVLALRQRLRLIALAVPAQVLRVSFRLLRLLKTPHKVFGILGRSRIRERIAGDEGRIWLGGIRAQVVPAPGRCLPVPHGFVDASFRGVPFRSTEGAKVTGRGSVILSGSRCLRPVLASFLLVRSRSLFDLLATVITAGEQVQPLLSASHERRLPERGRRHLPQRLQDARSLIAQAQIGLDGSLSHLGGSFSRHLLAIQAGHTFCGVTYAT